MPFSKSSIRIYVILILLRTHFSMPLLYLVWVHCCTDVIPNTTEQRRHNNINKNTHPLEREREREKKEEVSKRYVFLSNRHLIKIGSTFLPGNILLTKLIGEGTKKHVKRYVTHRHCCSISLETIFTLFYSMVYCRRSLLIFVGHKRPKWK